MSKSRYQDRAVRRSQLRHNRRRRLNRIQLLCMLLGILCLVIAGGLALWGLLSNEPSVLRLSLYYAPGGLVLLLIFFLMNFMRERKKDKTTQQRNRAYRLSDPTPGDNRSGVALVVVVVLLGVVAALVLHAQVSARARLRLEASSLNRTRLTSALTDAVFHALERLADDDDLQVDHVDETWTEPVETERPDGITTRVLIEDAQRRFDLNNLYAESASLDPATARRVAADLFTLCGAFNPLPQVDGLRDWIDPDQDGFREQRYYQELKPPIRIPNRWLASGAEVFQIEGFDRTQFEPRPASERRRLFSADLADCVTILPGRRSSPIPVNINTTSQDVLHGLFGTGHEALAGFVMAYRRERPLRSLDVLAPLAPDPQMIIDLQPFLSVGSNRFEVTARAELDEQALVVRADVERDAKGDVHLLRWIL